MFKRRDWVYTHNPDTGDVTSDSDTDGGSDVASDEGTSDAASVGDGYDEPGESSYGVPAEEVVHPRRMEDLQEILDSEESDDAGHGSNAEKSMADVAVEELPASQQVDSAVVEKQKAEWLQAAEGISLKGIPLRCLLCKDKLLINSRGFQDHVKSKAHLVAAKRHGLLDDPLEQLDSIVAAVTCRRETEETETHRERVERFQQIAESLKLQRQSQVSQQQHNTNTKRKKRHENQVGANTSGRQEQQLHTSSPRSKNQKRKRRRTHPDKPKRKKPGRRQRIEAKAVAAASSK